MKFQAIYLKRWTENFTNEQIYKLARQTWAESIQGLYPDDIKHALKLATETLAWPPSIAEFLQMAKSRRGSYRDAGEVLAQLDAPREYVPPSPLLQEYMAKHGLDEKRSVSISAQEFLSDIRQKLNMKEKERDSNVPDF